MKLCEPVNATVTGVVIRQDHIVVTFRFKSLDNKLTIERAQAMSLNSLPMLRRGQPWKLYVSVPSYNICTCQQVNATVVRVDRLPDGQRKVTLRFVAPDQTLQIVSYTVDPSEQVFYATKGQVWQMKVNTSDYTELCRRSAVLYSRTERFTAAPGSEQPPPLGALAVATGLVVLLAWLVWTGKLRLNKK